MATTILALRQNFLNNYLGRTDATTVPWSDAECNQFLGDAIDTLWADQLGTHVTGTVATNQNDHRYTTPGGIIRIGRIEIEQSSGGQVFPVDHITHWFAYSPTQVSVSPPLPTDATLTLRFFGWKPFALDATDLPDGLDRAVAMRAAGLAFGEYAAKIGNLQQQIALESGRLIGSSEAVGLSAYWERRAADIITRWPQNRIVLAPRAAYR